MYVSGEDPGEGKYLCTKCNKSIILKNNYEKLPLCPECYNHEFKSNEKDRSFLYNLFFN